ncbi:MAG: poly-gamma-glutamate biosynthesis protein, partial [Gammaproteobacteria bacterium]
INPATGKLVQLQIAPTQIRHLKINKADKNDALWLRDMLNRESKELGIRVELDTNGYLVLQ